MKFKIFKTFVIMILATNLVYAQNKPNIDKATFQEINYIYSKDKNGVYLTDGKGGWEKIEGLDPDTFQVLTDYIKDKNGVYIISDYIGKFEIEKKPYMDGRTFEEMDELYSKDKNNIYYKGERIIGVDIPTFEKLDKYVYSKDKNNIYFRGKKITGADKNTFEKIDERQYSKDKNNIYYENKIIEGADRNTFEILNHYYSKDKNNIYYENKKLKGIDVKTFGKINKIFQVDNFIVEDKNGVYIVETDGNLVPINSDEVDIKSLSQLVRKTNLYQDKNNMYFVKNHKLEKIKNAPKVDEFNLFVYNDRYINKYDEVYYLDIDEDAFKKVVKAGFDSGFRVFDDEYAKDKKNVYYRGEILKGADSNSFEMKFNEKTELYEIRDKNKIYKTRKDYYSR